MRSRIFKHTNSLNCLQLYLTLSLLLSALARGGAKVLPESCSAFELIRNTCKIMLAIFWLLCLFLCLATDNFLHFLLLLFARSRFSCVYYSFLAYFSHLFSFYALHTHLVAISRADFVLISFVVVIVVRHPL